MSSLRPLKIAFTLFAFLLPAASTFAAKPLEKLTACAYVEDKYNDGDSFRVKCGDKDFVARLYFIDAPETTLVEAERVRKQSQHFGISLDDTLAVGTKATNFTRETLKQPFELWTSWSPSGGRTVVPRYNAFVNAQGKSLIELLVSNGLARVYGNVTRLPDGQKSTAYKTKLVELESEARQKKLGAWANSKGK
ncbi:MAG: thermonuclease family protein [Betaproteobacteria bacterium]|nr:thermonuclease family protein [Betaproteobacteria bacterium]